MSIALFTYSTRLLPHDAHTWCAWYQELETELVVAQKKLQEQGNIIEEKEEELYELRDQLEAMVV